MRGARKVNDQSNTQRRGQDDRSPSSQETPRDVMNKVSEEAVKQINRIFEIEKKDKENK